MTFHVDSEVGLLKQAIVHRPGLELSRLTPANVDELLFEDVIWADRARQNSRVVCNFHPMFTATETNYLYGNDSLAHDTATVERS